jgi:membrane protein DedA with SNARE-associated domain
VDSSQFSLGVAVLVHRLGYWGVGLSIGVESMGLPVPGGTVLVAAAIYAATTHQLQLALVILAAIVGAVIGSVASCWIGRSHGHRLLTRLDGRFGINASRLKIGRYLFSRHGGKVVFLARFVPVLRGLNGLLAGVNQMPWPRFLVANTLGALVWATTYGVAGYYFGAQIHRLGRPLGGAIMTIAVVFVVGAIFAFKRYESVLGEAAELALPGQL